MTQRIYACACLACLLGIWPKTASASLGGDASSVDADRVHAQGALLRITGVGPYTVHEMQAASGTVLREYSSSTGQVFGVAWQGPWMPDLQQLLGAYFERYQAAVRAAQAGRRGHGPLVIDTPELVVRMGGHPRAFFGNAYLPALVPQGMQAQSIR